MTHETKIHIYISTEIVGLSRSYIQQICNQSENDYIPEEANFNLSFLQLLFFIFIDIIDIMIYTSTLLLSKMLKIK